MRREESPPIRSLAGLCLDEHNATVSRFLKNVEVSKSGHWLWKVRGQVGDERPHNRCWFRLPASVGSQRVTANRAAWMLFHGDIPEDANVYSTCEVKGCLAHLAAGTLAEVFQAAPAKRLHRGEQVSDRLRDTDVQSLLERWNAGASVRELQPLVPQVSKSTIRSIVGGRRWKHIEPRPARRQGAEP